MDMSNRVVKTWERWVEAGRREVKGTGDRLETSIMLSTIKYIHVYIKNKL